MPANSSAEAIDNQGQVSVTRHCRNTDARPVVVRVMGPVETVLTWSVPGWVIALVAVGIYELRRQRWRKRPGTPLSTTYVNEFTAIFYGTKRMELDHRDSVSLMREEDAQGAPPKLGLDLDRGVVVLRPAAQDTDPDGSSRLLSG